MSKSPKLTIIIPAYNEERRIGQTIQTYANYFNKKYVKDYEILVILNGCRDKTEEVIISAQKTIPTLRYVNYSEKIGKGGAITKGISLAQGDLVGFVDADLSTMPEMFDRLIKTMDLIPTVDCVIASRNIDGAKVSGRTSKRKVMTKVFNWYVNALFNLKIQDTQCGAKVFKRKVIPTLLPKLSISNMAFDVNFLVDLKRSGGTVLEIPIDWVDDENSTITKPLKTSLVMALSILRLRMMYSRFSVLNRYIFGPFFQIGWYILLNKEERQNRIIQN